MKAFSLMAAAAVCAAVCFSASAKEDARLLRFPATNGEQIVFTYAGDLWSVPSVGGQAVRLTSHLGLPQLP